MFMSARPKLVHACALIAYLVVLVPSISAEEHSKKKIFAKTPDEVFAAAERIVKNGPGVELLERDAQRRLLRFRWRTMEGRFSVVGEGVSSDYAIFVAEAEPRSGKTIARLTFGQVAVSSSGAWHSYPDRNCSKRFFRMLQNELGL
jgi:hypothetical protein